MGRVCGQGRGGWAREARVQADCGTGGGWAREARVQADCGTGGWEGEGGEGAG